jgi:hypothetical protein
LRRSVIDGGAAQKTKIAMASRKIMKPSIFFVRRGSFFLLNDTENKNF